MNAQPNARWTARSNIDGANVVRESRVAMRPSDEAPRAEAGGSHIVQPGSTRRVARRRPRTRLVSTVVGQTDDWRAAYSLARTSLATGS
jgi:hypothetical protein